ncbi:hypothetical protein [Pseudokordiimonas caeni]|uniref:hypothetical protein n=1 Tax=Pseudokordiimonas caeni TaxID=2997908 RepID=UPI002811B20A|nr:hypothetical protein [Pseudokordiimonas caeni]
MILRMGSERLDLPAEIGRMHGIPRRVYEHWCRVAALEDGIPTLAAFHMKAVAYADPYICLVGVEEDPRRYRMLRVGEDLISHYGADFTDKCLDELNVRNIDAIIELDNDIVATRTPIAALVTIGLLGIPIIRLNGIGVPLVDETGRISHIVSCTTREMFGFGV